MSNAARKLTAIAAREKLNLMYSLLPSCTPDARKACSVGNQIWSQRSSACWKMPSMMAATALISVIFFFSMGNDAHEIKPKRIYPFRTYPFLFSEGCHPDG